jgi:hypothetical protein
LASGHDGSDIGTTPLSSTIPAIRSTKGFTTGPRLQELVEQLLAHEHGVALALVAEPGREVDHEPQVVDRRTLRGRRPRHERAGPLGDQHEGVSDEADGDHGLDG